MSGDKLKKALKDPNLTYGTELTLKKLKLGKIKTVLLAKNCPEQIKKKISSYKIEIIQLEDDSEEIALLCKRPHWISVLSY